MSTEIKCRRGRPKKETPKYDQPVKVGMSRNDIMREALDSMYRLMEGE